MTMSKHEEALYNAFVTATEGGSNYWCTELNFTTNRYKVLTLEEFCARTHPEDLITWVDENDESFSVTRSLFLGNVNRWIPEWESLFTEMQFDAYHADTFLQHGLFDDIVFG